MKTFQTKNGLEVAWIVNERSNVFLVSSRSCSLLVDTSWRWARRKLQSKLAALAKDGLDGLVLTHSHFDHAGNAAWVKETCHAKVFAHWDEAQYLACGDSPLPAGTMPLTRPLMSLLAARPRPYARYEPLQTDVCVEEEYDLRPMGLDAALLPTPGHTRGSLSVIVDGEIAVVGDAMFGFFPGKVLPPFGNDIPEMIHSWKKLLDTGCRLFLPSHGLPRSRETLLREFQKAQGN